jgi:putative membrane protein
MSTGKALMTSVTAVLLTASVAAFAQSSTQSPNTSMPANAAGAQGSTTPPPSSMSMPAQSQGSSGAGDDDFVTKAATAGHEEVADAREALKDSSRADVKRVAAMLRRDHQMADRKLAQIAKRDGLTLPPHGSMASSTETNYSDSDYISSQIKAHQDAIALFQNESQNGQDPQLKAFAQKTLPKLEHHLHALEALQNT